MDVLTTALMAASTNAISNSEISWGFVGMFYYCLYYLFHSSPLHTTSPAAASTPPAAAASDTCNSACLPPSDAAQGTAGG